MCCGNSILQKGLPFFYLHKIFYTLYHDDVPNLKKGIKFIFTIRKKYIIGEKLDSMYLQIFDCYVAFVLKYIEKLSMKVERVIEKED